jgi:hypothetical protein
VNPNAMSEMILHSDFSGENPTSGTEDPA